MRGACAGACPSSPQRDRRNPGVRRCLARADARGRSPPCAPTLARAVAHLPPAGPIAHRCVAPRKFRGGNHFAAICLQAPDDAPRGRWASFEAPAPRLGGVRQQPSTPQVRTRTHHTCVQALARGDSPCCGPAGAVNSGRAMTRSVFLCVVVGDELCPSTHIHFTEDGSRAAMRDN